jgi:MFS family permease
MDTKIKLYIGSLFGIVGAFGLIFAPTFGAIALERPWSFIAGFLVGVICGIGVVLSIDSLLELRRQ